MSAVAPRPDRAIDWIFILFCGNRSVGFWVEIKPAAVRIRRVHFSTAITWVRRLARLALWLIAVGQAAAADTGPTLQLDYGHGLPHANPVNQFMYFVPLISPEVVTVSTNVGNTQCARVVSRHSRTNGASFSATCELEFSGQGFLQNVFDHARLLQRRQKRLQDGEVLARELAAITVTGAGHGSVEIAGVLTNGVGTVNEVKLHFNGRGQASPVTITLQDIRQRDGVVQFENELVARVNMLVFKRQAGPPKMEVSVDSVKRKDAGDGTWQNFLSSLKGTVANFFIPPVKVEAEGQQAMLDFGLALAAEKPSFAFPYATRLKSDPVKTK